MPKKPLPKSTPAVRIVPDSPDESLAVDVVARDISEIAKAMNRLSSGRLTRRALVLLVSEASRVSKSTVNTVLESLESLEKDWLK